MSANPAIRRPDRRIVRLVVTNWIAGILAGFICAGLVLAFDLVHVRTLLIHSDALVPGLALLFGGFGLSFGGVLAGTAVMTLGTRETPPEGGGSASSPAALSPIPVRTR